jgi:hypothetical protein
MSSQDRFFALAVGFILVILSVTFARAQHGAFADDVYITFRYARNFSEGYGLTYNPGQNYLGTSGPGYALLLGVLGKIGGATCIPFFAEALCTLSLFLISLALFVAFFQMNERVLGVLASVFVIASPLLRDTYGFEILPQLACVVWAYVLYVRDVEDKRPARATAVLLALATVLRPDGILWFAPILLFAWWSGYQSAPPRKPSTEFLNHFRGKKVSSQWQR